MIPPASRMSAVSYSIRRVVAEARKAEAAGKKIFYLNTGDPVHAAPPSHAVFHWLRLQIDPPISVHVWMTSTGETLNHGTLPGLKAQAGALRGRVVGREREPGGGWR